MGRRSALVAVAVACLCALPARAEDRGLAANLLCQPRASPGRVLCEVELEVSSGRLPWADALAPEGPELCLPRTRELSTMIHVGPIRER